jgi:hypothetical protein
MTRPRAAADFAVIGARMKELRRERLPALLTISQRYEREWKNCAASAPVAWS